jgi:hypothetical protein
MGGIGRRFSVPQFPGKFRSEVRPFVANLASLILFAAQEAMDLLAEEAEELRIA